MRWTWSVLFVAALLLASLPAEAGGATPQKEFGEARPDQALVYVLRPNLPGTGDTVAWDYFVDKQFLIRLKGGTYGFVHLEPGCHRLWGSGILPTDIELIPGQTYYLVVAGGLSLVSEEEGRATIDEIKLFRPPDPALAEKKRQRAEKWYPKMAVYSDRVERIEVEQAPVPSRPAETEGLIRVPQYAAVTLELMENVTSELSSVGEDVWFRVAEDAEADGTIWLPAGARVQGKLVQVVDARGGGISGSFEIVIPALRLADGTAVPLIGKIITTGRPRPQAGAIAFALGGFLGSAATKGQEAFELVGMRWPAWTRGEAWVAPGGVAEKPLEDGAASDRRIVAARVRAPVSFNPFKRGLQEEIEVLLETDFELASVELVRVGEWQLPDPPRAGQLRREESGWIASFESWDLLSHLHFGGEAPVEFAVALADGSVVVAEGSIAWKPEP